MKGTSGQKVYRLAIIQEKDLLLFRLIITIGGKKEGGIDGGPFPLKYHNGQGQGCA